MPQQALKSVKRWIIVATVFIVSAICLLAYAVNENNDEDLARASEQRQAICEDLNELEGVVKEIVLLSFSNTTGNTNLTALPSFDAIDNESVKAYLVELEVALNSTSTSSTREKVLTEFVDKNLKSEDCKQS